MQVDHPALIQIDKILTDEIRATYREYESAGFSQFIWAIDAISDIARDMEFDSKTFQNLTRKAPIALPVMHLTRPGKYTDINTL